MGTHETNDDGAMGLPLVALGPDSTRRLAVIADEQRMADVFQEAMLAVAALRGGCTLLDDISKSSTISERFKTSILMERAADSLETAIARANGGAA